MKSIQLQTRRGSNNSIRSWSSSDGSPIRLREQTKPDCRGRQFLPARRFLLKNLFVLFLLPVALNAKVWEAIVQEPVEVISYESFHMGSSKNPMGDSITLDSESLLYNGTSWMPVMGEFHFTRYPSEQWVRELRKMKAGGIDVVATYVFWIHHEEVEGEFDWSGRRDLRKFVKNAAEAGLQVIVRMGPWCHGEVRNGGLPDWLLTSDLKVRSNDPKYLGKVETLYQEIAQQLVGLLWKDGGPVIGIQLENEFGGSSSHLLTLKRIAIEAGLDTPIYTRTGWPKLRDSMPFGEMIPLYGVYAEGFWNHSLEPMPGKYREGFHFSMTRTSSDIGTDQLGQLANEDEQDASRYPYLTCEIGGGMMNSYHRRVWIAPQDVEATTLVKLGSGGNLLGYYMYHGGVNPQGKLTTLQESLATHYPNDMPVKNYDFQAPLGAFGQIRSHYHGLRRIHLFLHDYQNSLSSMSPFLPVERPESVKDLDTLRWSVRSDGTGGLVFVNNYERLQELSSKMVQFDIRLPGGDRVQFPSKPVEIPANSCFFWPFRFELAPGFEVEWLTAQPVAKIEDDNGNWTVFCSSMGSASVELAFQTNKIQCVGDHQVNSMADLEIINITDSDFSNPVVLRNKELNQTVTLIVLTEEESRKLWKGQWGERERIFLTNCNLQFNGDELIVENPESNAANLQVYPVPGFVSFDDEPIETETGSLFTYLQLPGCFQQVHRKATIHQIRKAGELRTIPLGSFKSKVAVAPDDQDFEQAAVWEVEIPQDLVADENMILRIHYIGDVARVWAGDHLIMDDFYNGRVLEIGLQEYWEEARENGLRIEIIPLQKKAPIYLHPKFKPDWGDAVSLVELETVEWITHAEVRLNTE